MMYIFDECMSSKLVEMMKQGGVQEICHATELWPSGTLDEVFLPQIGTAGHILVTRDPAMRRTTGKNGHLLTLKQYNVKVLFLPSMFFHMRALAQASWVFDHWEKIVSGVRSLPDPFLAQILPNGTLVLLSI